MNTEQTCCTAMWQCTSSARCRGMYFYLVQQSTAIQRLLDSLLYCSMAMCQMTTIHFCVVPVGASQPLHREGGCLLCCSLVPSVSSCPQLGWLWPGHACARNSPHTVTYRRSCSAPRRLHAPLHHPVSQATCWRHLAIVVDVAGPLSLTLLCCAWSMQLLPLLSRAPHCTGCSFHLAGHCCASMQLAAGWAQWK